MRLQYSQGERVKAAPLRSAAARRRAGLCLGGPPDARRANSRRRPPIGQLIGRAPQDPLLPGAP